MDAVKACNMNLIDEITVQQTSGSVMKRIPSESTVSHIAKPRHIPTFSTTWERSQSAANIDAAPPADNEGDQLNATSNDEQPTGTREINTASAVSGQTKNYWDLPSAISCEDAKQLSNQAHFNATQKKHGTRLETISQNDELQHCGSQEASSVLSVASTVFSLSGHQELGGSISTTGSLSQYGGAVSKPVQQFAEAHSSAHRTASDIVLSVTATRPVESTTIQNAPNSCDPSVAHRVYGASVNQLSTRVSKIGVRETESASSDLYDISDKTSPANLNESIDPSKNTSRNAPPNSHLHGTGLFGGANLNLAATDQSGDKTDSNQALSSNLSSNSVVSSASLSNSRTEVFATNTGDLNQ